MTNDMATRRALPVHARAAALALAALATNTGIAATFCADTAAQLQAILTIAQANGEDDEVRIHSGTYEAPHLGFRYAAGAGEPFGLEISGGWHPLVQLECAWHDRDPWSTLLTGGGDDRVLRIEAGGASSDVRVERIVFINGEVGSFDAAGLAIIHLPSASGDVAIESSVFLNNHSSYGAGLSVHSNGPDVSVVNNLFVLNSALHTGSAVAIENAGIDRKIVFTNNTVVANALDDFAEDTAAAVYFNSGGTFVANNNFWDNDGYDLDPGASGSRSIFNNNYASLRAYGSENLEGNLSVAPEYESGFLNYTPVRTSPLVDAGREPRGIDPGWHLAEFDINGARRVVGEHVDIGAFENERILVDGFDPQGPFDIAE